jgi:uncharacterized protein
MDKVYEISLLLDFYGQLLSSRQLEILDMHYNNDYSLAEIAEILIISRQGVFDYIKKGKALLDEMELKLKLVEKFSMRKIRCEEALGNLKVIDHENLPEEDKLKLKKVEKCIIEIMDIS